MREANTIIGLKFGVIVSLVFHILIFSSIEVTFGKKLARRKFELTKIFFLGPILQNVYCSSESTPTEDYCKKTLDNRILARMPRPTSAVTSKLVPGSIILEKPSVFSLTDNKTVYFNPTPKLKTKTSGSSIMFYPSMPYHFLLYFRDRQSAHMEVDFYISPTGKIAGLKRKISSGNPEVDLLIMRNLIHFLNLCKSNFELNSWQTVNIDLSP